MSFNRHKVILSLCDFTGNWPRFYREAGYEVRCFDLKTTGDVRLLKKQKGLIHGILAAPPCTVFANSGAWVKRSDADMIEGLSVVDSCLRLVWAHRRTLAWWSLEHPTGKLRSYLGDPLMIFDPCEFGDAYTKKTLLWGNFTPPAPLFSGEDREVSPVRACSQGSWIQTLGGKSERTKTLRSMTPLGFAKAFFEANP